jgi:hypothetical protein
VHPCPPTAACVGMHSPKHKTPSKMEGPGSAAVLRQFHRADCLRLHLQPFWPLAWMAYRQSSMRPGSLLGWLRCIAAQLGRMMGALAGIVLRGLPGHWRWHPRGRRVLGSWLLALGWPPRPLTYPVKPNSTAIKLCFQEYVHQSWHTTRVRFASACRAGAARACGAARSAALCRRCEALAPHQRPEGAAVMASDDDNDFLASVDL